MDQVQVIEAPDVPPAERRSRILSFEALMAKADGATFGNTDKMPLNHLFAGGIYCRQILIPKGFLVTGKIHRHEHPIFIMSGDLSIVDETTGTRRIKGPCHFVSPPGTKRLLYTHEDTVIVTVHYVGEERDIETIERQHTALTYEEFEKGLPCPETKPCLTGGEPQAQPQD